jgi:hypothetical protein
MFLLFALNLLFFSTFLPYSGEEIFVCFLGLNSIYFSYFFTMCLFSLTILSCLFFSPKFYYFRNYQIKDLSNTSAFFFRINQSISIFKVSFSSYSSFFTFLFIIQLYFLFSRFSFLMFSCSSILLLLNT